MILNIALASQDCSIPASKDKHFEIIEQHKLFWLAFAERVGVAVGL
jgi:hypothetical protein